jgi:aspartate/glutamate racemase
MLQVKGIGNVSLGIITVETNYPKIPGNVECPQTYDFPVIIRTLHEIDYRDILTPTPILSTYVTRAALELEARGVDAIVGTCGTFAFFQEEVQKVSSVPVLMSPLIQLPMILNTLPLNSKIAVLSASDASASRDFRSRLKIRNDNRIVFANVCGLSEVKRILQNRLSFDTELLERQLFEFLETLISNDPKINSILIQCSDLPPYANAIRRRFGVAVFDMPMFINWYVRESRCGRLGLDR